MLHSDNVKTASEFLLGNSIVIIMLYISGAVPNKKELPTLFGQLLICM